MGYEMTVLYHGRLLSPVGFARLKGHDSASAVRQVCKDRWILHAPGRHVVVGSIDAVIDKHEKAAGRILRSEVDKLLTQIAKIQPEKKKEWDSVTDQQMDDLKRLVKIAANDETAEPGLYMCEVAWSTLEPESFNQSLTYNLKVV